MISIIHIQQVFAFGSDCCATFLLLERFWLLSVIRLGWVLVLVRLIKVSVIVVIHLTTIMASGSLSASLVHPFGVGSSAVMESSSSGSTSVTPPPSGMGLDSSSVNHALLNHHLVMKNERHHQHRLYQPYNHLTLHHHHHAHHHHMQHQQQHHHHLENHYDLGQHYPVASTSGAGLGGPATESRCSSVSSSGADHHTLTLKSEQGQQTSSLETNSSLELLDNANVSYFFLKWGETVQ